MAFKFPLSIQVIFSSSLFLILIWVETCIRTIMAASSWNDNGQKQFVHDPCKILLLFAYPRSFFSLSSNISLCPAHDAKAKIICRCTLPIRFFSWPGVDAEEIDLGWAITKVAKGISLYTFINFNGYGLTLLRLSLTKYTLIGMIGWDWRKTIKAANLFDQKSAEHTILVNMLVPET